MNRTYRGGKFGLRAQTPRIVAERAKRSDSILDFGAGKEALHALDLRDRGFDVTAHEIGANFNPRIHDPDALARAYDIVYASNVLNVQPNRRALLGTIGQIFDATRPGGVAICNYPLDPRKSNLSSEDAKAILSAKFDSTERIGGERDAPIFLCEKAFHGKVIRGRFFYVHRFYEDALPKEPLLRAKPHLPTDAEYTYIKYDRMTGAFTFAFSPDFDASPEPEVGISWRIDANGGVKRRDPSRNPEILHGKHLFVKGDYPGFSYREAERRYDGYSEKTWIDPYRMGRLDWWRDCSARNKFLRLPSPPGRLRHAAPWLCSRY